MGACGSKEASLPVKSVNTTHRSANNVSTTATTKINNNNKPIKTKVASSSSSDNARTNNKKSGIKSETRRLGSKDEEPEPATIPSSKTIPIKTTVKTDQNGGGQESNISHAPVSNTEPNAAREMAARAAENRLKQQQKKNTGCGQLGKKLEAERRKNHKDYALEEYEAKARLQTKV